MNIRLKAAVVATSILLAIPASLVAIFFLARVIGWAAPLLPLIGLSWWLFYTAFRDHLLLRERRRTEAEDRRKP